MPVGLHWPPACAPRQARQWGVCSTRPASVYAWVAWQVGLNGCLDKALAWEDTLTLIHGLLNGAAVWPTDVWENVREFEAGVGQRLWRLSEADWRRWLDVLRNESVEHLAQAWGLSVRGAIAARRRLCEKLGVADEAEAKQLAWSAGLVKMHAEPVWSDALMLYRVQGKRPIDG